MNSVPTTTLRTRILLWSILILALTDFSLSLVHFGITSFFLGVAATAATIIHTITHLVIIFLRERGVLNARTEVLPPTSKLSSIVMDALLALLFAGAFTVTVMLQVVHYFGTMPRDTVVYADAAMQVVCGVALIVLAIIGSLERRRFLEEIRRIQLGGTEAAKR